MTTTEREPDTARLRRVASRADAAAWRRALLVLATGVVLSLVLFLVLRSGDDRRIELEFRRDASDRIAAFRLALTHGLDAVTALEAFYLSSEVVERHEFKSFVGAHLLTEPGVAFLGWAPRVAAGERTEFEAAVRRESDELPEMATALAAFGIFELEGGAPRPAGKRREYFPVLYGEPGRVGWRTLGFDVASDPVQGEAVARALETRQSAASGRDLMRPDEPGRFGVMVVNPIYESAGDGAAPESKPRGVLIGMFEVGAILEAGLSSLEPRGIDIAIHDRTAPPDESLLYLHTSRLGSEATDPWTIEEELSPGGMNASESVRVADREWLVSCRPTADYVPARRSSTPLLGLLAGLLLSMTAATALITVLGREAELRRATAELEREVGERRRAERRLAASRALYERILDSLPLNVFVKDGAGRLKLLNAEGRKLVGLTADEVEGHTDFDLFPVEDAEALRALDREVLATGRSIQQEETVTFGERKVHLLAGKTALELDDEDEPLLLGFSIDVTDLKQAEDALRRSEERFRQLVEHMRSGVAVLDAVDGGADFIVRNLNPAGSEREDLDRAAAVGRRFSEVFPGLADLGILEGLRRVWETGEPRSWPEMRRPGPSGERWRDFYAYRLPSGEVVMLGHDVTDRKRLEADLLHAQKMEAVGRLAGGVAHDFNNLLQVVAGNVDLLQEGGLGQRGAAGMLEEIAQQAERGAQLARRLLVFSRRETTEMAALDLRAVLSGMSSLVRRLIRENIEVRFELGDQALVIRADRGQLEQVVMNLVVNASDAMAGGGVLTIRAAPLGAGEVGFSVADTGAGLSPGLVDKIFDPYFTTKSAAQGTGLGLAVVDGIVSVHGGRIEVDNRPGEGVEFRIVLPRAGTEGPVTSRDPGRAGEIQQRGAGQRVLVVEDQALVRTTLRTMLGSLGYEVVTAADGAEARRLFAGDSYALLLSDMVLPDASGVELAYEFRGRRPDLGVLLVSGYADEALRRQAAHLRFLQKPFQLQQLADEVAAALRERR